MHICLHLLIILKKIIINLHSFTQFNQSEKNDEKKIFKSLADFPKSDIFKNVRNAISQNRIPKKNTFFRL
jgi:hypothetical protein